MMGLRALPHTWTVMMRVLRSSGKSMRAMGSNEPLMAVANSPIRWQVWRDTADLLQTTQIISQIFLRQCPAEHLAHGCCCPALLCQAGRSGLLCSAAAILPRNHLCQDATLGARYCGSSWRRWELSHLSNMVWYRDQPTTSEVMCFLSVCL